MRNLTLASLIIALAGCATSPTITPPAQPTMESKIDALMRDYSGSGPGASVLVEKNGEILFHKGYGLGNLEERTAVTPQTDFRLASITKQFTASAILLLVERGKLGLDDSVKKYLPELTAAWAEPITIRELLTHSSGIIDYEDIMPAGTTEQLHDIDVLHMVAKEQKTYFAPGTSYRYSNGGYALLSLIVERVSGKRFADFLRENIFAPAGMKGTLAFEQGVSTVPNRAFGYSREGSGWKRTDQSLTSAVLGDGGVYSSVDDLALWMTALQQGSVLSSSSIELASLPSVRTDDPATAYGFGWRISLHNDNRMVWHTGESIGFRNALLRFPEKGLSVIVLTNRDEGEPKEIALKIADMYL